MKEENYDLIRSLEDSNWWYKARRDLLVRILKSLNRNFDNCLDLGCGVGSNFQVLQEFSRKVEGVDYSSKAIEYSKRYKYKNLRQMNATQLKYRNDSFDLVVCLDVLEHVNDKKAIKEVSRILRKGGILIFSVPAHRYLWGPTDLMSEHKTRYEKEELKRLFEDKLLVQRLNYWNLTTFLPNLLLINFLKLIKQDNRPKNTLYFTPKLLNNLIYVLLLFENSLFLKMSIIQGVSIVGVCKKK